jgi:nitroimidazol reductase NimA-like FMN-containing flavoprotein (pyridoxamine 5'-phosphate oxidase superfamily)
MCDDGQPYIVPLNFGYDGRFLLFHMPRLKEEKLTLSKGIIV